MKVFFCFMAQLCIDWLCLYCAFCFVATNQPARPASPRSFLFHIFVRCTMAKRTKMEHHFYKPVWGVCHCGAWIGCRARFALRDWSRSFLFHINVSGQCWCACYSRNADSNLGQRTERGKAASWLWCVVSVLFPQPWTGWNIGRTSIYNSHKSNPVSVSVCMCASFLF